MFANNNGDLQEGDPEVLYIEPDPTQPAVYDAAKGNAPSIASNGAVHAMPSTGASKAPFHAEYAPGIESNVAVHAALTDSEYLDVDDSSFTSQPWYVAKLDKAACKARVFGASIGDFLVRESKHHPGSYAVCVKIGDGKVQEDLIERDPTSGLYKIKFFKDQSFAGLVSLVQHCQTHPITPRNGITLELGLGQPVGVVYADPRSVTVGVSATDVYGCAYGEVDKGLLKFFNRVVVEEAEIYDPLVQNPLKSMATLKPVSLSVALDTAANHCGSLAKAFDETKLFATNPKYAANLSFYFPNMSASKIQAILMYTKESDQPDFSLYRKMNSAFGGFNKTEGRTMAVHYLPYAQLLISALQCLPEVKRIVYRGVFMPHTELLNGRTVGDEITWWPFVSTTGTPRVLRKSNFFDAVVRIDNVTGLIVGIENNQAKHEGGHSTVTQKKTIFMIITLAGYQIMGVYGGEDEYLLLPGSKFKIEGIKPWHNGITEVRLRQVSSPYSLSAGGTGSSSSPAGATIASKAAGQLSYTEIDLYMALDSNEDVYERMDGGGTGVYSVRGGTGTHGTGDAIDMYGDALC
jgi:hypothetical protein